MTRHKIFVFHRVPRPDETEIMEREWRSIDAAGEAAYKELVKTIPELANATTMSEEREIILKSLDDPSAKLLDEATA